MSGLEQIWADPRLVYTVAVAAVVLLVITIWLFRRQKKTGRGAGFICLALSVILHLALLFLVPMIAGDPGGSSSTNENDEQIGVEDITFSTLDPELNVEQLSGKDPSASLQPLPVADLTEMVSTEPSPLESGNDSVEILKERPSAEVIAETMSEAFDGSSELQEIAESIDDMSDSLDSELNDLLLEQVSNGETHIAASGNSKESPKNAVSDSAASTASEQASNSVNPPSLRSPAPQATVPESLTADFANRTGAAKQRALHLTGGSLETEAAVKLALRFIADAQRDDGAWDARASGAGVERRPLGEYRQGAGTKSETALTGLALLALMGAGHTHQEGEYTDHVFKGLSYLIGRQKPNGSLAGDATVYAASYCHSMAALALCEAAALTKDPSAIEASRRAIAYSVRMQHPVTGGWRYTAGDPGDLSQLGWQAMVFDAGARAGIPFAKRNVDGVERFLKSVRVGRGGLACYRPGERASRTMTAEALATRLLIGQSVPESEIGEASTYLLQEKPGRGVDNYYYWYYATLALHQLQDASWQEWNDALQRRLLSTQRPSGSWPTSSLWGGYGGTIYTTSMGTLCLETYYRHAIRKNQNRITKFPVNGLR